MAGQAQLRCVPLGIYLDLPWWPTDVARTLSVRNVSELERADKRPLSVPTSLTPTTTASATRCATATTARRWPGISTIWSDLPVRRRRCSCCGRPDRGLFRIESASVTVLEFAANGKPSRG